jgi:predicted Zn-dependent peptidase
MITGKNTCNKVQGLTLKDVQSTAKSIVQPGNLGWFLAGDASKTLAWPATTWHGSDSD